MNITSPFTRLDRAELFSSPEKIAEFVSQLNTSKYSMTEKRSESRFQLRTPAIAQFVNSDIHPFGEPFRVIARDISVHGLGLIHEGEIDDGYLAVQLRLPQNRGGDVLYVVMKVIRSQQLIPTVYHIGGRMLSSHINAVS